MVCWTFEARHYTTEAHAAELALAMRASGGVQVR